MEEAGKINISWSYRPGKDISDKDFALYSKRKRLLLWRVKNTAGFVSAVEKRVKVKIPLPLNPGIIKVFLITASYMDLIIGVILMNSLQHLMETNFGK